MAGRINRTLSHPLFISIVVLSGGNKLLELSGIFIPFIHSWMDDLFCMPFVLTLALWAMRRLMNDDQYELGKLQILAAFIYCSVLFESVLPYCSPTYTADLLDVLAYFAGTIVFQFVINKPYSIPKVSLAERRISSAPSFE